IESRIFTMIPFINLSIFVSFSMPVVRAGSNVHTYYTNTTTVGTCVTLCKGLSTSPGTTSTSTVVNNIAEAASPTIDANSNSKKQVLGVLEQLSRLRVFQQLQLQIPFFLW